MEADKTLLVYILFEAEITQQTKSVTKERDCWNKQGEDDEGIDNNN
jgi:hypothetical protein